ncbi:MAG: YihY/virulence factor BrkB family protein [Actinomycetota bacterium]|nr:YihY/virulence factor BrkB family protein [Actinomycetota bacterium]
MRGPVKWPRMAASFVWDVARHWYYGGLGDLAAGVTFWIVLSLPAAVLALVSALGWLANIIGTELRDEVQEDVVAFAQRLFGNDANTLVDTIDQLFERQNSGVLTISLLFAFWTISRGFAGLLRALDGVYDVDDGRPWYITRVVALFLGLGSLLVSVPIVMLELFVWNEYDLPLETTLEFASSVLILLIWAVSMYHFGPSVRTKWHWDLPGAGVAAVLWWLLTFSYRFYVDITSGGDQVLGALGAFILALTWVWLAAQALLIGASVNSLLGDRLKINRAKRSWRLNERIFRTGEMKKIVLPDE